MVEPIYGEYLRNNDGTHLDSKIVDDKLLQERYSSVIIYPLSQYDLSTGHIGKSFVRLLAKEIDGVRERKWNIEKLMCFVSMILQRSPDFKGVSNIKRRIRQRILEWEEKKLEKLISSTIICAEAYLNRKRGGLDTKERAQLFSFLIYRGEIREAIRVICERETGGIMLPGDVDLKTGDLVKKTLESKHPEGQAVSVENLPGF